MISRIHKFIFVHIPRTGGTSIECNISEKIEIKKLWTLKHLTAKGIFDKIGKNKWDKYFKFTFVRNPWDRVISLYHQPAFNKINHISSKSLKYFLEHYKPARWEQLRFSDYLNHDKMDFIGRFENRANDLSFIAKKIGIDFDINLNRRKTNHNHYSTYYDEETKNIVYEMFKDDILTYNYTFDKE